MALRSYRQKWSSPLAIAGAIALALACSLAGPEAAAGTREESLLMPLDSGRTVQARVLKPATAGAPMPAVILLGGFERGAAALDLVQPSRATVLASFDYPIALPDRIGWRESLRLLPPAKRAIHDSFAAVGRLHSHLRARPDVDAARISIVGVSFGAPFAVVGAAEHAIPGLVVIHGFAEVPRVIGHQFAWRWAEDGRAWLRPLAWLLGHALHAYAALPRIEDQASRLRDTQQVWMLSASDDALIPPAADDALRSAFARSAARLTYETEAGGHLRGDRDPRIPDLLKRTEAWLIASGL